MYRYNFLIIKLLIAFFFCILSPHPLCAQTPSYPQIFKEKFESALLFYKQNQTQIQNACTAKNIDYKMAVSIVFPELMRYNSSRDAMETMGNRVLYANMGGNYGNFSIGCFQMKPLFIERLEKYIKENPESMQAFNFIPAYTPTDTTEIRGERVKRLSNTYWQIQYLLAFMTIVQDKFPLQDANIEEKLRFYATTYNRGFQYSDTEIKKWYLIKSYPDGTHRPNQYNYGQISLAIYQNFQNWIEK